MTTAFAELLKNLAEHRVEFGDRVRIVEKSRSSPDAIVPDDSLSHDETIVLLRRLYAMEALACVIHFLTCEESVTRCPDIVRWGLDYHLRDLLHALQDLNAGRTHDILAFKPKGPMSKSVVEGTFKGRVAAMSEMLKRAGETAVIADELFANALTKTGYKIPKNSRLITATTIRNWRKEARESSPENPTRQSYDRILSKFAGEDATPNELRRCVAGLMAGLSADKPGAIFRKVLLDHDQPLSSGVPQQK